MTIMPEENNEGQRQSLLISEKRPHPTNTLTNSYLPDAMKEKFKKGELQRKPAPSCSGTELCSSWSASMRR